MSHPFPAAPDGLNARLAALEIILRRLRRQPGLIDRLAGPYQPKSAPNPALDAFLAEVDDLIGALLALARAEASRPR